MIGTASRPESRQWALGLGAHHVVDHHDLVPAVREVAPDGVGYVFSPHTGGMISAFAEVLRPGGAITAIDEPEGLDILPLKDKSIAFHWEFMFTRPLFQTPDMIAQHEALERIAELADAGSIRTTLTAELSPFSAATLREAHAMVEDGHMTGKVVVAALPTTSRVSSDPVQRPGRGLSRVSQPPGWVKWSVPLGSPVIGQPSRWMK